MHIESDAVPGAVDHADELVRRCVRRRSDRVVVGGDRVNGRLMHCFSRYARPHRGRRLGLGFLHDGMDGRGGVRNVAVHDGAGAVSVVEGLPIAGEDIDDDRFAGSQRSAAVLVAVSALRSTGDDAAGIGVVAGQQEHIDGVSNPFRG